MLLVDEIRVKKDGEEAIKRKLFKMLPIKESELVSFKIDKRSLDLRKDLSYVFRVKIETKNEEKLLRYKNVRTYIPYKPLKKVKSTKKIAIIGSGPAGLFCALALKDAGLKATIFEKGKDVLKRKADVDTFFEKGILDPSSNVQYGEGGAGTFSDGKLTTRIKDPYIEYISENFIRYGAKPDIAIDNHPHIGTDALIGIIKNLREDLIAHGFSFHFQEEVTDFITEKDRITAIKTPKDIYCFDYCILAMGHGAKETIAALHKKGIYVESKDFAIGFRVEHPQALIDNNQYKGHKLKEAADYFLRYTAKSGRGVYSFCMCPGGIVIPACFNEKTIVTNGMSYAARDSGFADSAILVQVLKSDFGNDLFDGENFLNYYEKKAYAQSGSYRALSQNIKDYMTADLNKLIFKPTYPLGVINHDINTFYPHYLNASLKEAFVAFDRKIPGFIQNGVIIAPETRSTSPFRIKRGADHQSISHFGLYPIGEGAGYAGGIMSSALDGVKCALDIIEDLSKFHI